MKKVSLTLPQKSWGSLNTKFPANTRNVDVDELTEGSKNFDTDTKGALVKRKGGVNFNDVTFAGTPVDSFEAVFSSGVRHLLIGTSTGVLRASEGSAAIVAADMSQSTLATFTTARNLEFALYLDRVYMGNGIDAAQLYDRTEVYGGVNYGTPVSGGFVTDAGAKAPTAAVTYAADSAGGSVPDGDHTYKVTFLYYGFEDSNGGPASVVRTVAGPNNTVNLTAVPTGGYGVTARKIYRDDNDGVWRLVGTISDNTTTTFTDTASIGTIFIPTDNGIPPLFSLIQQHKDRNWMAGVTSTPSTIYFSDAGKPDIVRSTNTILCNPEDPITGLAVYNDRVFVFNRNSFGQILGTTSDTFRYSQIPGRIGCADNRTIQVRTVRGVPVLVWLSNKGFYQFNGSSVDYISEKIENLVNLNIQQAAQVKGQDTDTNQTDFQAGTPSAGIDTTSVPGTVTMANPKRIWSIQTEWEAGTALNGIDTNNTAGSIKNATKFTSVLGAGTFNNTVELSSSLRLPVSTDFTGEAGGSEAATFTGITDADKIAVRLIPTRTGDVDSVHVGYANTAGGTIAQVHFETESLGEPSGTLITTSGGFPTAHSPVIISPSDSGVVEVPFSLKPRLTGGQAVWMVCSLSGGNGKVQVVRSGGALSGGSTLVFRSGLYASSFDMAARYSFTSLAIAGSGNWISAQHDTGVSEGVGTTGTFTLNKPFSSEPGSTSITWEVHSSDTSGFTPTGATLKVTKSSGDISTFSATLDRYVKIKILMTTGDDRVTPIADDPSIEFPTVLNWESDNQDHTTDVTLYNEVVINATIPAGTSANVQLKTDDNAGFTSPALSSTFALADGLNTISLTGVGVEDFSRVIINMTSTSSSDESPVIADITYKWTVVSNLISDEIDTLNTPAGWDIFQADFLANGGTATFEMRTSATSGTGYSAFFSVTNGAFPAVASIPLNRYVQWRVTLTATSDAVPTVNSVTINWFISIVEAIRATSIFHDRSYFMAAAEFDQTSNNVVFKFDEQGKWRIYRDLNINVFSFFFNDPYYGSASEGRIIRFLQSTTDQGANITFDVRTKAQGFGTGIKRKVLAKLFVTGLNTGATYQFSYSLDSGQNFLLFKDFEGATSFTTASDGGVFTKRLVPQGSNNFQAPYLLIRVVNSDDKEVELHEMTLQAWIREGDVTNV